MTINPRVRAVKILLMIFQQKKSLQECFTAQDTPFIYQLTYGALRHYYALRPIINYALKQPLSTKDQDIYLLILLGIYQLQHLDIPQYAIVKETVDAVDLLKKSWAKKLINAILRRFLRERDCFEQQCLLSEEAQYIHPQWFIDKIKLAWPEQWQSILQANNQKAPMHLRVNQSKISREAYLDILAQTNISAQAIPETMDGLVLEQAVDVEKLPKFSEGCVSVQDVASQKVIDYLDLQPQQYVLDACAAPGGKTCHILERESHLAQLIALDVSAERIKKIAENLERLKLSEQSVQLCCGDAASPADWWKGKLFDRILLDAPCSATGVIRRHPDIKLLRTLKDIQQAVEKQQSILKALWLLLKSGGRLIYTTCSILPEENQDQITDFLKNHVDAKLIFMKQILPSELHDSDGFFYVVLKKN